MKFWDLEEETMNSCLVVSRNFQLSDQKKQILTYIFHSSQEIKYTDWFICLLLTIKSFEEYFQLIFMGLFFSFFPVSAALVSLMFFDSDSSLIFLSLWLFNDYFHFHSNHVTIVLCLCAQGYCCLPAYFMFSFLISSWKHHAEKHKMMYCYVLEQWLWHSFEEVVCEAT